MYINLISVFVRLNMDQQENFECDQSFFPSWQSPNCGPKLLPQPNTADYFWWFWGSKSFHGFPLDLQLLQTTSAAKLSFYQSLWKYVSISRMFHFPVQLSNLSDQEWWAFFNGWICKILKNRCIKDHEGLFKEQIGSPFQRRRDCLSSIQGTAPSFAKALATLRLKESKLSTKTTPEKNQNLIGKSYSILSRPGKNE